MPSSGWAQDPMGIEIWMSRPKHQTDGDCRLVESCRNVRVAWADGLAQVARPVEGDGGLERVVEDAGLDQRVAQVGHLQERAAPLAAGAAAALGRLASADIDRGIEPLLDRMVCRLETEH